LGLPWGYGFVLFGSAGKWLLMIGGFGWGGFGVWTTQQAKGAIPNGTRIEKHSSEAELMTEAEIKSLYRVPPKVPPSGGDYS